jgi:hypothetical protein
MIRFTPPRSITIALDEESDRAADLKTATADIVQIGKPNSVKS